MSRAVFWTFWNIVGITVMIALASPEFLYAALPIFALIIFLQRIFVITSNQTRRLESVARSPIYSLYGETLAGASSIRAYRHQQRFIKNCLEKVDICHSCYVPFVTAMRWMVLRTETLSNSTLLLSALLAVLDKGSITSGSTGLSVTYAMSMTPIVNWIMRVGSEAETHLVSVERCMEYVDMPYEPSWEKAETKPPPTWPSKGEIKFDKYSTRYREDKELVLKNISCTIKSQQKVGIVGRTGAGKSSLTLALFRLIEPCSGTIYIDDVDITTLGLHNLRSGITIIPQDPVLFSGSLRLNLDPFSTFSDSDIWQALEHSHLKSFASSLENGLDYLVAEGGDNLSVGQKQLLCLARALLRKNKVLILDEATAAVDLETDQLIQNTIRHYFSDCTIITIAHRLNTILDYDKVIVLDQGVLIEYDTPNNLLEDRTSIFHSMARAANLI